MLDVLEKSGRRLATGWTAAALLLFVGAGCEGGPTGPGGGPGTVSLSLTTAGGGGGAAASLAPAFSVEQTDGQGNELVLDSVQVVVREIELDREDDDDCETGEEADDDDCEEFIRPGLKDGDTLMFAHGFNIHYERIQPPAGVYDELEFEIHKPDDDDDDGRAFLEDHPEFEDVSIRVKGTYNGEAFTFVQDLNEEQEIDLSPPLEVGADSGPVNITLRLDVSTWFVAGDGSLVDPATANEGGVNEDLVEENIEDSIEAFEDDDRDGDDDDEDDDDDDSDDDDSDD